MTDLTIITIDNCGRFFKNVECLYVPQPTGGKAKCIIRADDGFQRPFDSEANLRAVVQHALALPGASFDPELVIGFALDTPDNGGPDPKAHKLPGGRAREIARGPSNWLEV